MIDSNVIIDTFDPKSDNYDASLKFMNRIPHGKHLFVMPMHGWFEIKCNLNKIQRSRGIVPPYIDGKQALLIEFIHIDDKFISNYEYIEIPFIKSKDHIFLVVAKVRNIPLITWDKQMTAVGNSCGITILNPNQWMASNTADSKKMQRDADVPAQ